jgi:methylthioribulose-1-phosphate dehydratase
VLEREPLRLAITPSGADKGALEAGAILEIDGRGQCVSGSGRPSAETAVHVAIARTAGAGAVAHTHSTWSTLLSDAHAAAGGLAIQGYEMLKGLAGVDTHAHREWIPILENTQDWVGAAPQIEEMLRREAGAHAFLIRRHGLYTWGRDVAEVRRHVEILEFLLEVVGRSTWRS